MTELRETCTMRGAQCAIAASIAGTTIFLHDLTSYPYVQITAYIRAHILPQQTFLPLMASDRSGNCGTLGMDTLIAVPIYTLYQVLGPSTAGPVTIVVCRVSSQGPTGCRCAEINKIVSPPSYDVHGGYYDIVLITPLHSQTLGRSLCN